MLNIQLVGEGATPPVRATEGSCGYDCFAYLPQPVVILQPGMHYKFSLGFRIELPKNTGLFLIPRSGMGSNQGFVLRNLVGLIDIDYRGEVFATMINNGHEDISIGNGVRICQMVLMPVLTPEINIVGELSETKRGTGGFGSTGQ